MTVENCLKLLEAYKKQSENPVNENGTPYTGKQANHARERSKRNYNNMAMRIINSRKFNGGDIPVRVRGGVAVRHFEKHPIVEELKKEFGLIKEPEVVVEKPKKKVVKKIDS